jgi:transcriptional regulator with XRE-family HTH domain
MEPTNSVSPNDEERDSNMPGSYDSNTEVAGARLRQIREGVPITSDLRGLVQDATRSYGLTIDEVAKLSKGVLSKTAISKLERGEVNSPAMDSLVALAKIYRMTPNDMAQLYHYWEPVVNIQADDPRVQRFLKQVAYYEVTNPQVADILLNALEANLKMVE